MQLLIVPYGIETGVLQAELHPYSLLIVPYGIETEGGQTNIQLCIHLLIVPYGIETYSRNLTIALSSVTFNCTLWN